MTYEEACQIAAQCWCDAETAHIEMDVRLAEAFARRLLLIRAEALEEAARIAQSTVCDTHLPTGVRIYGTRAADAIRAAKESS